MNIFNIRYGFACNSSSSHSLIFWDKPPESDEDSEFGWQYFTAADEHSRRRYASLLLKNVFKVPVDDYNLAEKTREFIITQLGGDFSPDYGYIDHDSDGLVMPTDHRGNVNTEFAQEWLEWFTKAPLAILGGNDNDDVVHPAYSQEKEEIIYRRYPYATGVYGIARKDPQYNFWTVFNPTNGTKLRFSFENTETPTRASTPELVDIKITDYCPYNCGYCYMGSTIKGTHADNYLLGRLVRLMSELNVFEVAIGGGEPTLHPYFDDFVLSLHANGIVPNFTTRNLSWLRDPVRAKAITEVCGAFAFSVDESSKVREAYATWLPYQDKIKLNIQVVPGAMWPDRLEDILQTCKTLHIPVTLLGYKSTGRGGEPKYDYDWMAIVKKVGLSRVTIDTLLAKDLPADVPPIFYHTQEGAWSMYIDAVTGRAGASSYSENLTSFSLNDYYLEGAIRKIFTELTPE